MKSTLVQLLNRLVLLTGIVFVIAPVQAGESVGPGVGGEIYPITLETALRLADERNTEIAIQLEEVKQRVLDHQAAYLEWLPTLRAGGSYVNQDGALQETNGRVGDVNRNARYAGLGAGAVGSGAPLLPGASLEIDLAEALFHPLATKQMKVASEAASDVTHARVLLQVAEAYYRLVRAHQAVAIATEAKGEADKLADVTSDFAETGEGLVADAERAAVESLLMAEEIEQSRGELAVASTQLARLLRLDDAIRLEPADGVIAPLTMVDVDEGEAECLALALTQRPELLEHRALVDAAKTALKERKFGPLIPKVRAAYSYGDFRGGPGSGPDNSGQRHDVGVALYWQLDGLGFLNRNETKRQASQLKQSELRREQIVSDIISEVRSAHALMESAERRMTITRSAVSRARKANTLNQERIFENQGLPLESLQAMQAMARAEELNLRAAMDYNLAQLRLFVATGGDLVQGEGGKAPVMDPHTAK
jgi:outer membrane protein TolC